MDREAAIAALESLPAVERISVAKLEPGDVIVLQTKEQITAELAEYIARQCEERFWPQHKVLVLPAEWDIRIAPGDELTDTPDLALQQLDEVLRRLADKRREINEIKRKSGLSGVETRP